MLYYAKLKPSHNFMLYLHQLAVERPIRRFTEAHSISHGQYDFISPYYRHGKMKYSEMTSHMLMYFLALK